MQTENIVIARICHDLITPCNAINLGIEAYEMSEDKGLLACIKESASKANVILKFFRELFQLREESYLYSIGGLQSLISEFLNIYDIEFSVVTKEGNLPYNIGKLVLYDAVVMKEVMPMGGKVMFDIDKDHVNIVYSGNGILEFDTKEPEILDYKNILRSKLIEQAKTLGFVITSVIDQNEGRILEMHF